MYKPADPTFHVNPCFVGSGLLLDRLQARKAESDSCLQFIQQLLTIALCPL